jgi:hypothetical protein
MVDAVCHSPFLRQGSGSLIHEPENGMLHLRIARSSNLFGFLSQPRTVTAYADWITPILSTKTNAEYTQALRMAAAALHALQSSSFRVQGVIKLPVLL